MKRRDRLLLENISQLPMVNPDLVTGISLMLLFLFVGLRERVYAPVDRAYYLQPAIRHLFRSAEAAAEFGHAL